MVRSSWPRAVLVAACVLWTSASYAKTLVYCSEGDPEAFNPALAMSGTAFDAGSRQIFDRLVEFDPKSDGLIPGLAASWQMADNGLTYTMDLRRGVHWQRSDRFVPSRDFNADDVVFSFERQRTESHPFHKVSGGSYPYFEGMGFGDLILGIDRVDDYTIRFRLASPDMAFLADLAMDFASIQSAEYADRMLRAGTPEEFDRAPIGTGPFQLVRYDRGAQIRYGAHPDYWRGRSPIDTLVFVVTPDPLIRYARLRSNECQAMPYPNPGDLDTIRRDRSLVVVEQPVLGTSYLAFNTEKAPFNNKLVREAVNLAIDRAAIIRAVFAGGAQPAANPLPPEMWGVDPSTRQFGYDPARARELLAQAGVAPGTRVTLWAMTVQRPYNPDAKLMAQLIQQDLRVVGIAAEIVTYDWSEYLRRTANGEHDLMLFGWISDNGDPDNFLTPLLSCQAISGGFNRARWCSPEFDQLTTEAVRTVDADRRADLYRRAQAVFADALPWAPIAYPHSYLVLRGEVTGYQPNRFGLHAFYGADVR